MKKHQNSLEKPINLRPQTTDHLPNPPKRNTPVYIVTQKKGKERERERERERESPSLIMKRKRYHQNQ
jgi:hypothetical protein